MLAKALTGAHTRGASVAAWAGLERWQCGCTGLQEEAHTGQAAEDEPVVLVDHRR